MEPKKNHPDSRPDGLPADALSWLSEHPDVSPSEIEEVWRLAEFASDPIDIDADRVERMRGQIADRIAGQKRPRVISIFSIRSLGLAASVAFVLAIGAALWLRPIAYSTGTAEMATLTLPDGSTVKLNSGTTVSYRRSFGWFSRSVELDGEAFFDVQKDQKDFVVGAFNGSVRVLGTRFNVRSRGDERTPETDVFVEEGIVRVTAAAFPDDPVTLVAGQRSIMAGDNAPSDPVDVTRQEPSIWRDGGLAFSGRPLGSLLAEIERRFGVEVKTEPDSLADVRISLYLSEVNDVGTILDVVSAVHGLQIESSATGYILSR